MTRTHPRRALAAVAAGSLALLAGAQPPAPSPAPPAPSPTAPTNPPAPPAAQAGPTEDPWAGLPHQVRIGIRVALIRRNLPVVPVVVVVPDAASYMAAIGQWSLEARFPVLIDDGTWAARQDIARFVRAFEPKSVVRWSDPEASIPEDVHERRRAIERAVARAWGAEDVDGLKAKWESVSLVPPGVVAMNERDPAWTAGLALAAGRGQIIAWVPRPRNTVSFQTSLTEVDHLSALIEQACESSGYSWDGQGDDIEGLTLCVHEPVKIDLGEGDKRRMWATTDVLGRHREGERKRRWAWAGQIFGSEARAAYRAMCGLFLQPRNAWLFDGYDSTQPWVQWDATAAATELEKAGIATVVNDHDGQGVEDFRLRASGRNRAVGVRTTGADGSEEGEFLGGTRFGMILVNSSGEPGFFDLRPGRGLPGDVPLMATPPVVYFVHSWSANRPTDRATVGGRFVENGAYAYVGSVHEPYLQGFVPTPLFARRLMARAPLGVAARMDDGAPWKIAMLADPLLTFGPAPPTLDPEKLPLKGAASVQNSLAAALKERRFEDAIRDLVLMGRDEPVARLVRALDAQDAASMTPALAREAIASLYFAGAFDLVTRVFPLAISGGADEVPPEVYDILWHTLGPILTTLRAEEADLLRLALRPDQLARDGAETYRAIQRTQGDAAARRFADDLRARLPDEESRRAFNEALSR